MNNIVASEGTAKMCALLLGAVLNIGLDPIFIYILRHGGCWCGNPLQQFLKWLLLLYI